MFDNLSLLHYLYSVIYKLDGVGPVDTRLSDSRILSDIRRLSDSRVSPASSPAPGEAGQTGAKRTVVTLHWWKRYKAINKPPLLQESRLTNGGSPNPIHD